MVKLIRKELIQIISARGYNDVFLKKYKIKFQ